MRRGFGPWRLLLPFLGPDETRTALGEAFKSVAALHAVSAGTPAPEAAR